jgi:hypothetical protein
VEHFGPSKITNFGLNFTIEQILFEVDSFKVTSLGHCKLSRCALAIGHPSQQIRHILGEITVMDQYVVCFKISVDNLISLKLYQTFNQLPQYQCGLVFGQSTSPMRDHVE